ncbi:hypothetical protein TrVE_jg8083 [Triparma verrucosa]|uniref:Phosphoglycerate mutase n=1 Tax=Triparma verrucosa TaxID=1606542 RepID=A0A9W7CB59_9STRA|nr:hypothetical protein TrVE_jg8083 [Triparma verrucosa]
MRGLRLLIYFSFACATALQPSSSRRFILCRHGETNFNREGRIQGTLDTSFLTLSGVNQAVALGSYLLPFSMSIKNVYVSPMTRALQTLSIVKGVISGSGVNLPSERVVEDLREIELYTWQGRLKSDLELQFPEQWKAWKTDPEGFCLDGKSPLRDLWGRVETSWDVILNDGFESNDDYDDNDITLIICHGALGKCMIQNALGVRDFRNVEYALENCEAVEIKAGRWRRLHPVESEWK